jgi:hypothetical protein
LVDVDDTIWFYCKICHSGFLISYEVTLTGSATFDQLINITGINFTASVSIPPLGVQAVSTLTVIATSSLGETLAVQVPVQGAITLRTSLEQLLSYPLTPVVDNQEFTMNFTNLTQGCGDSYSITLRDPTNTTSLLVANNSALSGSSDQDGFNPIELIYTLSLGTVYSESLSVSVRFCCSVELLSLSLSSSQLRHLGARRWRAGKPNGGGCCASRCLGQ